MEIASLASTYIEGYSERMEKHSGSDAAKLSGGMIALGIFFFFGATMAFLAGFTLFCPGTVLDHLWKMNAPAYAEMAPLGKIIGPLFLLLSALMVLTGIGWFKRRFWGWILAVIIMGTQFVGDMVNMIRGEYIRGGVGALIAVSLLFYLARPATRRVFTGGSD